MNVQMDAMIQIMSQKRKNRREGSVEEDPITIRTREKVQSLYHHSAFLAETLNQRAQIAEQTIQQLIDRVSSDFLDPEEAELGKMEKSIRITQELQESLRGSLGTKEDELKRKGHEVTQLQESLQRFQDILRHTPYQTKNGLDVLCCAVSGALIQNPEGRHARS